MLLKKELANLAFWIENICTSLIFNMKNFYRICINYNKLIKLTSFFQVVLKKIFPMRKDFWNIWFPKVWKMIGFKNLYLHNMDLSHILLILIGRGCLGKCWFGLVWRNSSKNLESILGLSIGFFLFNCRHCIRGFCSFWIGFGLLRAHFPCRNSRDKKPGREFESPLINSISKSKTDKIAFESISKISKAFE